MTTLTDLERIIENSVSDELDQAMETATAYAVVSMFEAKTITQDQLDYVLLNYEDILRDVTEEAQEHWQNIQDILQATEDDTYDFDAIDHLVQIQVDYPGLVARKKVLEVLAPAYAESINIELVKKLLDDENISTYRIAQIIDDLSDRQIQNIRTAKTFMGNVKFDNLKALEKAAISLYEK